MGSRPGSWAWARQGGALPRTLLQRCWSLQGCVRTPALAERACPYAQIGRCVPAQWVNECPDREWGGGILQLHNCSASELLVQRGQASKRRAGRRAGRLVEGRRVSPGNPGSRRCLCTGGVAKGGTEAAEEHRRANRMSLLTGPARASGCVGQAVKVAVSHATPWDRTVAPKVGRERSRCALAGSSVGGTCFFRMQAVGGRVRSAVATNSLHCRQRKWDGQKQRSACEKNRALRRRGTAMAVHHGRDGWRRLYLQILSKQRLATARPEGPGPRKSADQHRTSYMSVGLSQCNAAPAPESRRQFAAGGAGDSRAALHARCCGRTGPVMLMQSTPEAPSPFHSRRARGGCSGL